MIKLRLVLISLFFHQQALAQDVKLVGQIDLPLPVTKVSSEAHPTLSDVQHIALLKIELSAKAQKRMISRTNGLLKHHNDLKPDSVPKIQLGMGNVPVLNQGAYGSCVTFANTAAIDAILNQGDYISQLCLLQLGSYLEKNGYHPSGWSGSFGNMVLNQMSSFGWVNKAQQRAHGCGGLTEYPLYGDGPNPTTEMTLNEYHPLSEPMDDRIGWSAIVDGYQILLDQSDLNNILHTVKTSLIAGDRLTFGVLLPDVHKGVAGAVGKYHAKNDSWVLTPEIVEDMKSQTDFPGHEMVITGFDDEAIAIDDQGRPHKGLLTLRNSWGERIGDRGDFYMSYDYFKALMIETQRIRDIRS